jgi:hypothetical protein
MIRSLPCGIPKQMVIKYQDDQLMCFKAIKRCATGLIIRRRVTNQIIVQYPSRKSEQSHRRKLLGLASYSEILELLWTHRHHLDIWSR